MKKIVAFLMLAASVMAFAEGDVTSWHLEKSKNTLKSTKPMIVGNNVVTMYEVENTTKLDRAMVIVVSNIMKEKICGDPDLKKVVDMGLSVTYIYFNDDNAMAVMLDKCD